VQETFADPVVQATLVYYRGKRKTTFFLLAKAFTSIAKLFIIR
jgi:hypothetical protein